MDTISLAPGLTPSSRLGFGCGSVMGRVGRSKSLRAIAAAIDAGITHFDVARLYGYGEAEAALGEAIRGKRDRLVIASKFGLTATRAAAALRGLKPLAQKLASRVPGLRAAIRSAVGTSARSADRFSAEAAKLSLEQSLRALGTDHLDILFLHDCAPENVGDELLGFLDAQVAAGTIRHYGAATGIEATTRLIAEFGDRLLYQFANGIGIRNAELLPRGARRFIAHSPLSGIDRVTALIQAQPDRFRLTSGRLVGLADVPALMLGFALAADNVAVVLCSMLDEAHLRDNLAVVERPRFGPEEIAQFAALVAAAAQPG